MTAHVAEAGEGRGRVVLRCSAWAPNDVAIEAALLVANAFQSEVELLFVEDSQRIEFARFPFAREFSLRDGTPRPVSARAIEAEARGTFSVARKRVASVASEFEVHVYEQIVRDDPVDALASACAQRGPWNMIAIAETFGAQASFSLDEIFDTVTDATGVIVAGSGARPLARPDLALQKRPSSQSTSTGPVVLAIEDTDHLHAMLRAGRFIATTMTVDVVVLLIAATDEDLAQMDGEVRLALSDHDNIQLARGGATLGNQAAAAETIRRLLPGFLIAQHGGIAAPRGNNLRPLINALTCPVLLVR